MRAGIVPRYDGEKIRGGKNSLGTNEAFDLEEKRVECREVNEPRGAKKNPSRQKVSGFSLGLRLGSEKPSKTFAAERES